MPNLIISLDLRVYSWSMYIYAHRKKGALGKPLLVLYSILWTSPFSITSESGTTSMVWLAINRQICSPDVLLKELESTANRMFPQENPNRMVLCVSLVRKLEITYLYVCPLPFPILTVSFPSFPSVSLSLSLPQSLSICWRHSTLWKGEEN